MIVDVIGSVFLDAAVPAGVEHGEQSMELIISSCTALLK